MAYEKKKLIDCCVSVSDGDHLPPPKTESGVPFITISNINANNQLDFSNVMYVPEEYYQNLPSNKKAQLGDVLYTVVGSFGKPVYICDNKKFVFQRHIAILKPNENMDSRYLYYTMLNPVFYKIADKIAIGCAQRTITLDALRNIVVDVPSLAEQKSITGVLKAIDEKITLNNRVNDNLHQQALLIFDYMFPNLSGAKHMGDYIIPKRGNPLLAKDAICGDIPVVAGGIEPSTYHNASNTVEPVITISSSGANAGFVNIWGVPVWSSDSSYIDSEMSPYVYFWYGFLKRHQKNIFSIQTGSAQPHIYPNHISSLPIGDIDCAKMEAYTNAVSPMYLTIAANYRENKRLVSLRDWLLPMLMNGQVTVSD